MFDEVLRIEMVPLGVKVLTIVTGSVKTNINVNGSGFEPKPESKYASIESNINNLAHGNDIPNQMSAEVYAEKVVNDILGGAKGKIWRGGNSTIVRVFVGDYAAGLLLYVCPSSFHVSIGLTFH